MEKYKWLFDDSGVLTECDPKIDGDTKLEYAPESGQIFYRAKLNGTLAFRFEFDDILAKGFGYEHIIVLQRYDGTDFVEVWRGQFTLTECTIDYETHTITVSPQTLDRYTKVLDALEKEYNITKLPIKQESVNVLIRPCLQIYSLNDYKLTNCIGYNSWEISCDAVGNSDIANYHFIERAQYFAICIQYNNYKSEVAGQRIIYWGTPDWNSGEFYLTGKRWNGSQYVDHTLFCECGNTYEHTHTYFRVYYPNGGGGYESGYFVRADFDYLEAGTTAVIYYSEYSPYTSDATAQWNKVYCRLIAQTELSSITIHQSTYQLYDLTNTDMAGANMNYNKVMEADFIDAEVNGRESAEPTAWGLNYNEKYFEKPADVLLRHYAPAGQDLWKYVSIWWYIDSPSSYNIANDELTATRRIKDCYDYRQTIARLLNKAGVYPDYLISGCLGGTNDYVGARTNLLFTPRSNVISSYYDTPAQNAPISLSKILNMLKAVYKCYWHIDSNGNFHIEHISYYQNGYSYTEDAQQLVDLETTIHTRTRHSKAFGQNVVKFAINDMFEQFTFGWSDQQTRPFDGFPIDCLDTYVQKGSISEQVTGDFDSDVDYVLASPNDVSKEGFFLFALPASGADYSTTLQVETVRITDELGDTYNVMLQNADAAFVKIHKTWWRYNMPCENLRINNETDTAITTGRFKQQSVEFADLSMEDVIDDIDNCVKLIRTQQGDGGISKLSVNLNSLATSADLLFTLFGRKYYLKGTALNGTLTFILNGETITINVENNRFIYGYTEPIADLTFKNTDVVSVDFSDADALDSLTSADEMFENCVELVGVDFGNKTFGAVTSATDMFAGCVNLTTLICPATETWKADIDFNDCPALTLESFEEFIDNYLFVYDSGVHTITPNSTMWNNLAAEIQNDLMAKATAKGWQIGIPAQYSLTGTSAGSTVYVTINGTPVEIAVSGGVWQYDYNTPITTISFLNDTNVQTIDFSNSDLLAGVSSLANAFKGCSGLVAVDFTGCDLSNVSTAADCFAGCSALTTITADSGAWMPDVDLSDTAMAYSDMLSTIGILYTYNSGTHTITFNSTTWDALSVAQQQTIFDAAQLKYWTTNAVAVVYHIKGKSTAASETLNIAFILDGETTAEPAETLTLAVDGSGNFEYQYLGKKIYSLSIGGTGTFDQNTTITELEMNEPFDRCITIDRAFNSMHATTINLPNATFEKVTSVGLAFAAFSGTTVNMPKATFADATNISGMFYQASNITAISLPEATFASATTMTYGICRQCANLQSVSMPKATFANLTTCLNMFRQSPKLVSVDLSAATFASATNTRGMFRDCSLLEMIYWSDNLNFNNVVYMGSIGNQDSGMFISCPKLTDAAIAKLGTQQFASCVQTTNMFVGDTTLTKIDLHSAIFGNLSDCWGMFTDCTNVTEIDLSAATFAKVATTQYAGYHCFRTLNSMATLKVPENSTAILPTSAPANAPMDLHWSPLNYASMLKVANWLSDLTGQSAHTLTFKTSAWNALSSAEQTTIDGILNGKNWTRAIA